jgi:carboxypeptidase T
MARLRWSAPLAAGLALGVFLLGLSLALPAAAQSPAPAEPPHLVRITYPDKATLSLLDSQGWDIWEVHPDYAVAVPPPGLVIQALPAGVTLTDLGAVPPASFDAGYHTYTTTIAAMRAVSDTHPGIVTLFDIGDGWETLAGGAHRHLWAARVAGHPGQGKPAVLFMAAIHAREIATPEVALNLLSLLADGYGVDPLITFLVNERETWIVPMVNPDGHIHAETGFWWRKNVDTTNGACNPDYSWLTPGVDLNRNFHDHWGWGGGSNNPCDETYWGPTFFSEPEDLAMKALVEAPTHTAFSSVISYHAYGNDVLYPWGYTADPPVDSGLMAAMAAKVASYNGYTPAQASTGLYFTNGDTCDWTWGAHGIPCFTVEMGGQFMPPYSAVAGLWDENRPGALYALNIADQNARAFGPEVTQVQAVTWPNGVTVTALVSDLGNGGQVITAAQLFVDALGVNGAGQPMSAADGSWSSVTETVTLALPLLPPGRHTLYVRGADAGGHWGSVGVAWAGELVRVYLPVVGRGGA